MNWLATGSSDNYVCVTDISQAIGSIQLILFLSLLTTINHTSFSVLFAFSSENPKDLHKSNRIHKSLTRISEFLVQF